MTAWSSGGVSERLVVAEPKGRGAGVRVGAGCAREQGACEGGAAMEARRRGASAEQRDAHAESRAVTGPYSASKSGSPHSWDNIFALFLGSQPTME